MAVKVFSCLVQGLDAKLVEVEADIFQGMPAFTIVGLGDAAVQEAKERIHSAIKNSGANYPQQKKIINLAPAHFKKNGPHLDLPMAIGLLGASKQIEVPTDCLFIGELALNGTVRPINGALSIALFAKQQQWKKLFLPAENAAEAALIGEVNLYPVETLKQLIDHLKGDSLLEMHQAEKFSLESVEDESGVDFLSIHGQENSKRALEICAASNHHLLI